MRTFTGGSVASERISVLDCVDLGQMLDDRRPALTFVGAPPHLAARGAEVHADGIVGIDGHRLALHRVPRSLRETLVESCPRFAGITRHVRRGPAVRTRAGPD